MNDNRVLMARDASTGIARITLNNPERRNSYDAPMREQLGAYLDELAADDGVKVVKTRAEHGAKKAFELAKAHFDVPEP